MPQSLAQVWLHIVFSTKERRSFLRTPDFREEIFRMLAHHVKETGCVSASVGGHIDHVHLLVGLSRTLTIAQLIESIKTETSKWAKKIPHGVEAFQWQSGYGAFSVSHSRCDSVDAYIRNQAEHHQKLSFQDEFRVLCKKHAIEIDERYVWDRTQTTGPLALRIEMNNAYPGRWPGLGKLPGLYPERHKTTELELQDSCDGLINLQNAKIAKQAAAKSLRDAAKADKLVADRGTVNYTEELKCMTLH